MSSEYVEIITRFVNQGSEQLDRVAASVDRVTSGATDATSALGGLEKGVAATGKASQDASQGIGALMESIKGLSGGMVGVVATATVTATMLYQVGKHAYSMVAEFGKAAEGTENFAIRLGITNTEAERFQVAARIAGVNANVLEGASRQLSSALEDGAGSGKKNLDALHKLGIETYTVAGGHREMGKVVLEVLEQLSHIESTSERVSLAQQALGRGASKELQPLLADYAALNRFIAQVGVGLDENLTKNLAAADNEIDKMHVAWEQLKKSFAGAIAPVVVKVTAQITAELLNKGKTSVKSRLQTDLEFGYEPEVTAPNVSVSADPGAQAANLFAQLGIERGGLMSEAFRKSNGGTIEGMRARVTAIKKEMAELQNKLYSGSLSDSAFGAARADFGNLDKEDKRLTKAIKAAEERVALFRKLPDLLKQALEAGQSAIEKINTEEADMLRKLGGDPTGEVAEIASTGRESLLKKYVDQARKDYAQFAEKMKSVAHAAIADKDRGLAEDSRDFSGNIKRSVREDEEFLRITGRTLDVFYGSDRDRINREASKAGRISDLATPVGQERQAAESAYAIRKRLAEDLYQSEVRRAEIVLTDEEKSLSISRAKAEYVKASDEARIEREIKILELSKKQFEEARNAGAGIFDALLGGKAGINNLIGTTLKNQGRAVFSNLAAPFLQKAGEALGGFGESLGLPAGVLRGTLLDPSKAKTPQDRNTESIDRSRTATEKLTGSVDRLAATMAYGGSGSGLGGGLPDDALSNIASGGDGAWSSGGTGSNFLSAIKAKFSLGSLSKAGIAAVGSYFLQRGMSAPRTTAGDLQTIGGGAAMGYSYGGPLGAGIGAAAASTYAGWKYPAGDPKGALEMGDPIGAGVFKLGGGPNASLAANLAIGGIPGMGYIRSLFSDRKAWADSQDKLLESRRFSWDARPETRTINTQGNDVYFDQRGVPSASRNFVININAIDVKSFADHQDTIATMVKRAVDADHPLRLSVQRAALS